MKKKSTKFADIILNSNRTSSATFHLTLISLRRKKKGSDSVTMKWRDYKAKC